MSKPDTPFPRYRYYYVALKILLLVAAVALAFKLYNTWE
jgi:putative effector of murein hydrolase